MGRIRDFRLNQVESLIRRLGPLDVDTIASEICTSPSSVRHFLKNERFKCVRLATNGINAQKAKYDMRDSDLPEVTYDVDNPTGYTRPDAFGLLPETQRVLNSVMYSFCLHSEEA